MDNPFSKPSTLDQLVVSSLCWVISCVAVFFGVIYSSHLLWPAFDNSLYVLGCAALICVVMWRRVIAVGWRVLGSEAASLYWGAVGLWLLLLTALLVLSVPLIGLGFIVFHE